MSKKRDSCISQKLHHKQHREEVGMLPLISPSQDTGPCSYSQVIHVEDPKAGVPLTATWIDIPLLN